VQLLLLVVYVQHVMVVVLGRDYCKNYKLQKRQLSSDRVAFQLVTSFISFILCIFLFLLQAALPCRSIVSLCKSNANVIGKLVTPWLDCRWKSNKNCNNSNSSNTNSYNNNTACVVGSLSFGNFFRLYRF